MTYVASDLNASMLYLESLPLWTRGLVSILDHPALLRELRLLERIPGRIGKDHPRHYRGNQLLTGAAQRGQPDTSRPSPCRR
jgi:hypothetical protein